MNEPSESCALAFADFEQLREVSETKTEKVFVWPDEGNFTERDGEMLWVFRVTEINAPLLVDPVTAELLVAVHDALSSVHLQERFRALVTKGRREFIALVQFCWDRAKSQGTHVGNA